MVREFSISIEIKHLNGNNWWFTGVYGPNKQVERNQFWDELVGLYSICGRYWCISGDLNVVRFVEEKHNSSKNTRSMRLFNEIIIDFELIDPPLTNAQFTWSNILEEPICYRFDHFFV